MVHLPILGLLTVILNPIVLILLGVSIVSLLKEKIYDIQLFSIWASIGLLMPVIMFENILFLDLQFGWFGLNYSQGIMKIIFMLGIIGYMAYNLHLLTIEDIPYFPSITLAVIAGFGIGSMFASAMLDQTNVQMPIYYKPEVGGVMFILSLMVFNIIGVGGFLIALLGNFQNDLIHMDPNEISKISVLDSIGIFNFFISPILIYLLRIFRVDLPFNFIFMSTQIAFIAHLSSFIISRQNFGYPVKTDIQSVSIINLEQEVVIAGYSSNKEDMTKIQGMTLVAVETVLNQFVDESSGENRFSYFGNYGDAMFLRHDNFLLFAILYGQGKKMGEILFQRFLEDFVKNQELYSDRLEFYKLCRYYFWQFTHKKYVLDIDNIFVSSKFKKSESKN